MLSAQKIVDILLGPGKLSVVETGEPDQDYDHVSYDAIVAGLEAAGIHGATHREFDKYQGVYIHVPNVGKFWTKDWYPQGSTTDILLIPSAGMPAVDEDNENAGEEGTISVAVETEGDQVTGVDVQELSDYCQSIINAKIQQQACKDVVDQTFSDINKHGHKRK